MRVLSVEEQRRLVRYLHQDTDVYKFGVLLTLYTGLRIGELCALHWNDLANGRIKVRKTMQRVRSTTGPGTELWIGPPKTETSMREIPVPSFLVALVERFRLENQGQAYVLGTPKMPIVEPRVMQYKFKRYLLEAEIEHANFHSLRHSFATRSVECGFDVKSLTEILGHAKVQITLDRYVHSSFALKCSNMEKLRQIL
ncbi:MAG: site-specific integrase [Ruminococcaceae bacterium]|nr:site-specific integrase [Oscillospiraceae bacterium]